jgi:beta-glucosidase
MVTYGFYHGYTLLDKLGKQAAFPFGYGLSYTQFEFITTETDKSEYDRGDTITILCRVKNVGNRAGSEVVQVYVGKPESITERHKKNLKAFGKVYLNPGELQEIILRIPISDLAYYDPDRGTWVTEPGMYEFYVGNSSNQKDLQTIRVHIAE